MLNRQEPVLHSSRGFAESNTIRGKYFLPNPSARWVCFLANMRYIRVGIYTGYIRRRIYISVLTGKKDKKYLIKKINQSISLYECRD